jgi:excisionase family DNA binding protein
MKPSAGLYTVAECASILRVSRLTIYRWIQNGRLEARQLGVWGA